MPFLMFQEMRTLTYALRSGPEEHHIAYGERSGERQSPVISGGDQQSARPFPDVTAGGPRQQHTQAGGCISHVGKLPKPLCWRHVDIVANACTHKRAGFRRSAAFY